MSKYNIQYMSCETLRSTNYDNYGYVKCVNCGYGNNMKKTRYPNSKCVKCGHVIKFNGYKYHANYDYADLPNTVDTYANNMKVANMCDNMDNEDISEKFDSETYGSFTGVIVFILLMLLLLWIAKNRGDLKTAKGNTNIPVIIGIIFFAPMYLVYLITDGVISISKNHFDSLMGW